MALDDVQGFDLAVVSGHVSACGSIQGNWGNASSVDVPAGLYLQSGNFAVPVAYIVAHKR
jgi:hypothetical protein